MMRHYRTLDGMRGVAALAVVVMHAHLLIGANVLVRGYLAVDLFFALSGLVLAHAYGARFDAGLGAGRFMVQRTVRLYPLYLLGTAVGSATYLVLTRLGTHAGVAPGPLAGAITASLLMLPVPWTVEPRGWLSPFNIAGWSLLFELGANLLLVLLWRRLTIAFLATILLVSGVAFAAAAVPLGHADLGSNWATVLPGIPRALFSFFVGVALHRLPLPAPRHSRWAWALPLALVPLFLPWTGAGAWWDLACILIVFPTLIWAGAAIEPVAGREGIFEWLGLISFALYALHGPLLVIAIFALAQLHVPAENIAPCGALVVIPSLTLLAWIADRHYDGPLRRRFGRLLHLSPAALT